MPLWTFTIGPHWPKAGLTVPPRLAQALVLEEIVAYGKLATGAKYLINPNRGRHAEQNSIRA